MAETDIGVMDPIEVYARATINAHDMSLGAVIQVYKEHIYSEKKDVLATIPCILTGVSVDNVVSYGHTYDVPSQGVILGHKAGHHVGKTLSLELVDSYSIVDALYYLEKGIMASSGIIGGIKTDISYESDASYCYGNVMVSDASINIHQGTMGASLSLHILDHDVYSGNIIPSSRNDIYSGSEEYPTKSYIQITPRGATGATTLFYYNVNVDGISIVYGENIRKRGEIRDYAVYPKNITKINAALSIPNHPMVQNSNPYTIADVSESESNIDVVSKRMGEAIKNGDEIEISTETLGEFRILPTEITTTRSQYYQGVMSINGILLTYRRI